MLGPIIKQGSECVIFSCRHEYLTDFDEAWTHRDGYPDWRPGKFYTCVSFHSEEADWILDTTMPFGSQSQWRERTTHYIGLEWYIPHWEGSRGKCPAVHQIQTASISGLKCCISVWRTTAVLDATYIVFANFYTSPGTK
jgi:hypothetical protein